MKLENFKIGGIFIGPAGLPYQCTDKGQRTIAAIMLDPEKDESWFVGPPYAVEEIVFDEFDMEACYEDNDISFAEHLKDWDKTAHPGFILDDMHKMMKEKLKGTDYPSSKLTLLKRDRVGDAGEIFHPYAAHKVNDEWKIMVLEVFTRHFSEISEQSFLKMKFSDENALVARKSALGFTGHC